MIPFTVCNVTSAGLKEKEILSSGLYCVQHQVSYWPVVLVESLTYFSYSTSSSRSVHEMA